MNLKLPASLIACLVLSCAVSHADMLIGFTPQGFSKGGPSPWDDTTAPGSVSVAPGVVLKNGLERGAGIAPGGTSDSWGGGGWNMQEQEAAISEQDFFTFTIAPAVGKTLSLQSLQCMLFRGPNSATSFIWQYQVGSGPFADLGQAVTASADMIKGLNQDPIDLSKFAALQKVSEPVTFRMVGWGAATKGASWGFGKSAGQPVLQVEGTVSP